MKLNRPSLDSWFDFLSLDAKVLDSKKPLDNEDEARK